MNGSRRRGRPWAFNVGDEVEVRLEGRGLKSVWYEARVVGQRPEPRGYSVVYDSLAHNAVESRPLREAVFVTHMRPRPPRGGGAPFALGELVDAFYNGGWWSGVVSKVPDASGKYAVRFPNNGEEMEFVRSELRIHLEWISKKWVTPKSQDKFIIPQKRHGGRRAVNCKQLMSASSIPRKSKVPHTVSLRGDDSEAPCKSHTKDPDSEMKSTEGSIFGNQLGSSQPCKKLRKQETIEDNTQLIDCMARCPKISSKVKIEFNVTMPTMEKRPNFQLKNFLFDKFHRSMSAFKEKSAGSPIVATETPSITSPGEFHDEPFTPAKFIQEYLVPQTPLTINEPIDREEDLFRSGGERNDQQTEAVTEDQLQKCEVPHSSCVKKLAAGKKRKRKSIPRKLKIVDTKASTEGTELKQLEGMNNTTVEGAHTQNEVDMSTIVDSRSISCSNKGMNPSAIVDSRSISCSDKEMNQEGSPSTLEHEGDSMGDLKDRLVNVLSTEGHSTSQTESVTQDNTCIKGLQGYLLSSMMLGTSNSMLLGTSNLHSQHNESVSEAQNESLPSGKKSSSENSTLPFEKRSPLWKTIESMEVNYKMLQPPHFQPLKQYSEVFREGMAIGLMVTYSNLVDIVGNLKIDDSNHKFDEFMKTLVHLQGHGFDVQHVVVRIEELLRIKSGHEQLVKKSSELDALMIEKEKDRVRQNADLEAVDKVIMELKKTLDHLYERKTSILRKQEQNASDMVTLQIDARVTQEGLQSAERNFNDILAATR